VGSNPILGSVKSFLLIVSKPQTNTIVSFTIFLVITLVVLSMNLISLSHQPAWYTYLIIVLLVPIALLVIYKIFLRYKIIRMGNNQVEIHYPVMRRKYQYSVNDVVAWKENVVKTGKNSVYKELEIRFHDKRKLNFGHKEQTEYNRIVSYLSQKAAKKKTE
jgi:magnesium-transporting ATPase (P-type)